MQVIDKVTSLPLLARYFHLILKIAALLVNILLQKFVFAVIATTLLFSFFSALKVLNFFIFILTLSSILSFPNFLSCGTTQEGQTCLKHKNCDSGLHCGICIANGSVRPRCTRVKPVNPTSQVH